MSVMKRFAEDVSVSMGLDGEITEAVTIEANKQLVALKHAGLDARDIVDLRRAVVALRTKEEWSFCGGCDCHHPVEFGGDCRDDSQRLVLMPADMVSSAEPAELAAVGLSAEEAEQLTRDAWGRGQ